MTIETIQNEGATILAIAGRIDSNTSEKLQEVLLSAIDVSNEVVLDFSNVDYISSAGLRVLLMGQKKSNSKNSTMDLTNVSEIVMQVLETVGFSKILSFK